MRFASIAVLLLLAAGCGHETSGTPAAETPRVAPTSGTAQPAAEPAAPQVPPPEPGAAPVSDATPPAPPVPPAEESPRAEAPPTPVPAVAKPATPKPSVTVPVPPEAPASEPPGGTASPPTAAPGIEPVAPAAPQPIATAPPAPRAATPAPPATPPTAPETMVEPPAAVQELDLKALEDQLRQTKAIGFMTKLTLKGQVNDLLDRFREYYQGKAKMTMKDLRRSYDLLMMKVLSLIQDADQQLASAIVASREAIWGLLADPVKFETLQG